jgi:hypothetical protein
MTIEYCLSQSDLDADNTISTAIAQHQLRRMRRQLGLLLQLHLVMRVAVVIADRFTGRQALTPTFITADMNASRNAACTKHEPMILIADLNHACASQVLPLPAAGRRRQQQTGAVRFQCNQPPAYHHSMTRQPYI